MHSWQITLKYQYAQCVKLSEERWNCHLSVEQHAWYQNSECNMYSLTMIVEFSSLVCPDIGNNWYLFSRSGVFVSYFLSYFEVPVSRVMFLCISCPCACLPCSWLVTPVWLLAPPSLCPPVSRSPVSNHLHLPVYLNPVLIIDWCFIVLFSMCGCYC